MTKDEIKDALVPSTAATCSATPRTRASTRADWLVPDRARAARRPRACSARRAAGGAPRGDGGASRTPKPALADEDAQAPGARHGRLRPVITAPRRHHGRSRRSRSASSRSSRPACCRSCRATCRAVSGVSVAEISASAGSGACCCPAIVFCLTFTLVFVALGHDRDRHRLDAQGPPRHARDGRRRADHPDGRLFLLTPLIPQLNREWRVDALMQRAGSGGPLIAGAAFAIAWTPCVGPTLGAILTAAADAGHGRARAGCCSPPTPPASPSRSWSPPRLQPRDDRLPLAARPLRDRHRGQRRDPDRDGHPAALRQLTDLNIEARKLLEQVGLDDLYNL